MNILRLRPMVHAFTRTYASMPFVPPQSLEDVEAVPAPLREKPFSKTFYTSRARFWDSLRRIEDTLTETHRDLRLAHLFPFPDAARGDLPPPRIAWKNIDEIGEALGAPLTTARYRHVHGVLTALNEARRIAVAGAEPALAERIDAVLTRFERADKDARLGRRKPARFDEYGRTYALGRRKESSARVWVIPVRDPPTPPVDPDALPVQPTTILVNNVPLAAYFPNVVDRQRVVRPFKLASLFGAFNVFALVRGGGTTGQAGAIAHGISRNLVAHVPEVELVLRRAKLLKRDPRMVERKKTGLAKARKRYTWVKR